MVEIVLNSFVKQTANSPLYLSEGIGVSVLYACSASTIYNEIPVIIYTE